MPRRIKVRFLGLPFDPAVSVFVRIRRSRGEPNRTIPEQEKQLGWIWWGMMNEGSSDRRDFAHWGDTAVAGSSTGWTDEKHMLYLGLLEESFVSQLYDSEFSQKGLLCRSPRALNHINSSKADDTKIELDQFKVLRQGHWGMVEFDRAKSRVSRFEHIGLSSRCEDLQDRKACCIGDDASTTEAIQDEVRSHARARTSAQSSARRCKHRRSVCRNPEGSDQNFVDEETKGSGESSKTCNKKRLRSAGDTLKDQVVPCGKAKFVQKGCNCAQEKYGDNCDTSSEVEIGSLNTGPASSACKDHRPKG